MIMRVQLGQTTLELVQGDITQQTTDAIVNAANSSLLGGGGVDGAIHRAAGPSLLQATRKLGGCDVGDAKITPGFNLKARHIIHAVGPVYREDDPEVVRLLASAYRRCLETAAEHGLRSVAFPAISTGVYGYPMRAAADTALATIWDFLAHNPQFDLIRVILYEVGAFDIFSAALQALIDEQSSA
jgi:O-acetyl-ADP-ribose deacetylase (regulator of RNase III)